MLIAKEGSGDSLLAEYERESIDLTELRGSEALLTAGGFAVGALMLTIYAVNLWGVADKLSINGLGPDNPRHKNVSVLGRAVAGLFALLCMAMVGGGLQGYFAG